jgi:acetyltransferase-like isoleucine patch superfamily enzyme
MMINFIESYKRRQQLSQLKKHPNTQVGSLKLGDNVKFIIYPNAKEIKIGNRINFRDSIHVIVQNDAKLHIEDNVFMNNFCSINCLEAIFIGENTLFGENVKLYDHNHEYERNENGLKVHHSKFTKGPIHIGKNCWLGSNVTVLKGVTIGDNCIIGAGCVIFKDVPANTTVINNQDLTYKTN